MEIRSRLEEVLTAIHKAKSALYLDPTLFRSQSVGVALAELNGASDGLRSVLSQCRDQAPLPVKETP